MFRGTSAMQENGVRDFVRSKRDGAATRSY